MSGFQVEIDKRLLSVSVDDMIKAESRTMTELAKRCSVLAKRNVKDGRYILRNKWTENSMRFDRSTTSTLTSYAGSINPYMADQEFGGTKRPRSGSKSTPIATPASVSNKSSIPRKKLPKRQNRLSNIEVRNIRSAKGKKNLPIRAKRRIDIHQRGLGPRQPSFFYEKSGKKKGIFRVTGIKRLTIRLIHDLSHRSIAVKRTKFLEPARDKAITYRDEIYIKELDKVFPR